jgi:hypothetical protein
VRKTLWAAAVAAALCLAAPGAGRAGLLTFDEPFVAGVPNPAASAFSFTRPLTEFYAPMGVHFSGPDPFSGGAILSDDSNFGVSAHSGTNFLAFNRSASYGGFFPPWLPPFFGGKATDPETIAFDDPQSSVSIWAAGGFRAHTFQMQAFGAGNVLLGTDTLTTQDWSQLTVAASGIQSVVLTEIGKPWDSWVYDDLSFTPQAGDPSGAPEPASLTLLGLAGIGLAGWRWRGRMRAKAA